MKNPDLLHRRSQDMQAHVAQHVEPATRVDKRPASLSCLAPNSDQGQVLIRILNIVVSFDNLLAPIAQEPQRRYLS